jgi:mannose-6-phosphate isomerase
MTNTISQALEPFRLNSQPVVRVWGGNRISELFPQKKHNFSEPVGEWWEIHGSLTIRDGANAGLTLDQLVQQQPQALLGQNGSDGLDFPLLVKWLDCKEWLSVQIHPDDSLAQRLTGNPAARGKTECWYFYEVDAGSEIVHSLSRLPNDEELAGIEGSQWLDWLNRSQVNNGEWWMTEAGIVHALGPGVRVLEIQQSSDITYRLYDWDRVGLDGQPRQLHVEEAKAVLREKLQDLPKPSAVNYPKADPTQQPCVSPVLGCPFFQVEEVIGSRVDLGNRPAALELWCALSNSIEIAWEGGQLQLDPGESAVIPHNSPSLNSVHCQGKWTRVLAGQP